MKMAKGKFITFEGGEGCGKSTQVKLLGESLESCGIKVLTTREPGGTWLSEKIRELIKDQSKDPPCDRAELLLFLAARAQLVEKVIMPALESGVWVVSDRFSDSTFAYQGYGRGLDLSILKTANGFACSSLKPDLTILLDVEQSCADLRRCGRELSTNTSSDRIELAGADFHSRLRAGFEKLAAAEPERIVRVDASGDVAAVRESVWKLVKRLI